MALMVAPAQVADEVLAARAARGDRSAFEALVRRHTGALVAFCRRVLGDPAEAEDRAQEAWLRAFRALDRFDASRRFAPWLFRIAHNACVDALRARKAWAPLDDADLPTSDAPPLRPELAPHIAAALDGLPPRQRAVLHLRFTLDLDAVEIGARLDMTPGNVRVVLHRALHALRERLSS
jgi:RNA polymerase sigma-70 factor (ECF subfamily)